MSRSRPQDRGPHAASRAKLLRIVIVSLVVIAAAAQPSVAAEAEPALEERPLLGDPTTGATKSGVCGGCHGVDGNAPVAIWPKLAGQNADYIAKQLQDFRKGNRTDPMMTGMASILTDQDVLDLAAHFEQLEIRAGVQDEDLAAIGERLYLEGRPNEGLTPCVGCHGTNGDGFHGSIPGGFPAIGGQNTEYVKKQLQAFRSETRSNDWSGIMRFVAKALSDDEITALAEYLVGLVPADE